MSTPTVKPNPSEIRKTLLNDFRTRFIKSVSDISLKAPSTLRAYLDSYARHCSPSVANHADAHFPQTVKRHPTAKLRTQHSGKNANLLAYIGITLLEYYNCVNVASAKADHLIERVTLLEGYAEHGSSHYEVIGNDGQGYTLKAIEPKSKPEGQVAAE